MIYKQCVGLTNWPKMEWCYTGTLINFCFQFCGKVQLCRNYRNVPPYMHLYMELTVVLLAVDQKRDGLFTKEISSSVHGTESYSKRIKIGLFSARAASDEPPFSFLECRPGDGTESFLPSFLATKKFKCCEEKVWKDQ